MWEVVNVIEEGLSLMSLQYLSTSDRAIRGKLLPESLIIYAIVQVLHIQIHPLELERVRNAVSLIFYITSCIQQGVARVCAHRTYFVEINIYINN